MLTFRLGRIQALRPLSSGKVSVRMPVMPKKIFTLEFLCTLNLLFIGIIGLGISV
ncbi:hypothetical protein MA16_Dca007956 [Dendrobium catenatum]|uniref:Uncharacterized protein n=1 Tax=Dendrobium catenatum TaxID=906689 RepID=A0A2I0XJE3_9ASPA|nr:hypothetical protein MA16_Dca007956 [Dendrobium catenatum]